MKILDVAPPTPLDFFASHEGLILIILLLLIIIVTVLVIMKIVNKKKGVKNEKTGKNN